MSPRETPNTTQIGIRLEHALLARLNAIREKLSRPGMLPTISDTVRMVLLEGLPVVERREGIGIKRGK